eukprot:1441739-Rhodomonas_salina.1
MDANLATTAEPPRNSVNSAEVVLKLRPRTHNVLFNRQDNRHSLCAAKATHILNRCGVCMCVCVALLALLSSSLSPPSTYRSPSGT